MIFVKIFRCCNFIGSTYSININRACHTKVFHSKIGNKILYDMRTAYFQHSEGEEKVFITINITELSMCKVLNFERNILEKLVDFVKKLDTRIKTLCAKKLKKKNPEVVENLETTALNTFLFLNNEEVPESLLFEDLFQNNFNGDLKLRILDNNYDVHLNSPLILSMSLPKYLQVGCIVGPDNYKTQSADINQSDFTWFKSKTPSKEKGWEMCGSGQYYMIKPDDYNYYLKALCTPKMNEKVGPAFEVISQSSVEKVDNFDVISGRQKYTKEKTKEDEFRIVSYNILADLYVNTKEAKTQIFTFCDPAFLVYDYRKNLLITELIGYNADILCMQEVERKFYNSNLLLFYKWGYEGLYHEKEGTREGSAIFYDRNKFSMVTSNQYAFTKELLNNPLFSDIKLKIVDNETLIARLMNVTSQIQVTVLECVRDNILVVGNVHFYFHPDADHIRLLQGVLSLRILLNAVEEVKKKKPNKKVSIVLCGDFNSTPECGFHQLLSEGSVDSSHICWRSKENEIIEDVSCSHSLKMKSCYNHDIFTNYIPTFKACIDYIYFQTDHLEFKQSVPVPSEEVLSTFSGIPSQFLPSDHVALIADFKFKNDE